MPCDTSVQSAGLRLCCLAGPGTLWCVAASRPLLWGPTKDFLATGTRYIWVPQAMRLGLQRPQLIHLGCGVHLRSPFRSGTAVGSAAYDQSHTEMPDLSALPFPLLSPSWRGKKFGLFCPSVYSPVPPHAPPVFTNQPLLMGSPGFPAFLLHGV